MNANHKIVFLDAEFRVPTSNLCSVIWKSTYEHSTTLETATESHLLRNASITVLVLEFLDLHDLMQLIRTGNTILRRIIYSEARNVCISFNEMDTLACPGPIFPTYIFDQLATFQSLHSVSLVSLKWKMPMYKSSPLLLLPQTLRHLTILASQFSNESFSNFMFLPWSTHFPLLETLRLNIETYPYDSMPRVGYFIRANQLPQTLRVLSLTSGLIADKITLMQSILYPIGYDLERSANKCGNAVNWSDSWHAHSEAERASFTYNLPNIEYLELPVDFEFPPQVPAFTSFPDLAVIPPALETFIYGPLPSIGSALKFRRSVVFHASNGLHPTPSSKTSSLTSLLFHGVPPVGWLQLAPPSVTQLIAPEICGLPLNDIFPCLKVLHQDATLDKMAEYGSYLQSSTTTILSSLTIYLNGRLSGFSYSSAAPILEPALASKLAPEYPQQLCDYSCTGPYAASHIIALIHGLRSSPLTRSLLSMTLSAEALQPDCLGVLPPNLTDLTLNPGSNGVRLGQSPINLSLLPPKLRRFVLLGSCVIPAADLIHLPASLTSCSLPTILLPQSSDIAPNAVNDQSLESDPHDFQHLDLHNDQIVSVLNGLPRGCTFSFRFAQQDLDDILYYIPLKLINRAMKGTAIPATVMV